MTQPNADDLKERLRSVTSNTAWYVFVAYCVDAADHIERLESQLAEARKVLEPFAREAEKYDGRNYYDIADHSPLCVITFREASVARAALQSKDSS